jgi:molybdenum cofactor cytidylyltransferase
MYTAILTAAGYSSRMGNMKALLPWHGTSLILHQISILKSAGCEEIVVVVGHRASDIENELESRDVVIARNNSYQTGRTSSIKIGVLTASNNSEAYVLLGVDQPRTTEIVSKMLTSHKSKNSLISSPRFKDKGGHPIILSATMKNELLDISENTQGLRQIFEKYRGDFNEVIFNDPLVRLDINTYEEYEEAIIKYGK